MQKTLLSRKAVDKRFVLGFVLAVILISSTALAADPSYYVKKVTWQETMLASREALMQQEKAAGVGMPLPNLGKSDFTIMAWIKTTAEEGTIVAKAPAKGEWEPQGKVFFIRDGDLMHDVGWVGVINSEIAVNDGQWRHVALAGRKPLEFYLDGKLVKRANINKVGDLDLGPDDPDHVVKIGYCTPNFGGGFEGDIDEVRIYNRRLSPAEVKAVFENTAEVSEGLAGWWKFEVRATDSSGGKNHGKIYDAVATEGKFGKALRFNGRSSVLLPPSPGIAARKQIWDCIIRDFTDDQAKKQIQWEQQDNIWTNDWKIGDLKGLGRRYAKAAHDIGGLAEKASKLVPDISSRADLEKVQDIYHLSYISDEVYTSGQEKINLMRDEIAYLDENYSKDNLKWQEYKANVEDSVKIAEEVLLQLAQGDTTAIKKMVKIEKDVDKLHKKVPLVLAAGSAGPGRFGAYYTRLKYSLEWDRPWRVGSHADVVVRFDDAGYKFVFWRGTSYIPCWVTDTGVWYNNEFIERRGHHSPNTEGCVEPMSDKQCRFSHVRIIESNDARVVVHWRYAPVDVYYNHPFIDPLTGWSDWVDEYYTIYPNAVSVRKVTVYTTRPDLWTEWQESIVVNQPGTMPEDNIELGAVTLANMQGESKTYYWTKDGGPDFGEPKGANILKINLKAKHKPFAIVAPPEDEGILITPYKGHAPTSHFNFWDHWPVSQVASDGRVGTSSDRPSHSSLCHIGLTGMATATWKHYARGEKWRTKIMLHGMTDKPVGDLVPLANSWLQAPELKLAGRAYSSEGYDPTQLAYVLVSKNPGKASEVMFELVASKDSPVVNPAFVIKNWGDSEANLKINGRQIKRGKDFRFGHRRSVDYGDLVAWIKMESIKPVKISFSPAKD